MEEFDESIDYSGNDFDDSHMQDSGKGHKKYLTLSGKKKLKRIPLIGMAAQLLEIRSWSIFFIRLLSDFYYCPTF